MFNIVSLPIISSINIYHLYVLYQQPEDLTPPALTLFSMPRISHDISWNFLWYAFLLYLLIDLAWISIYPNCVPQPMPIVIHHLLLLSAWMVIFCWDGYEFYMSAGILLEINTFFLIGQCTRAMYIYIYIYIYMCVCVCVCVCVYMRVHVCGG